MSSESDLLADMNSVGFLRDYIASLTDKPTPVDGPNKYKGKKEYNILYKVWDNVYVHTFSARSADGYTQYKVIEPERPSLESLDKTEELFAKLIGLKDPPKDVEAKEKFIREQLEKILGQFKNSERFLITYHFIRDKLFSGPLEPLIRDNNIEDISIDWKGKRLHRA